MGLATGPPQLKDRRMANLVSHTVVIGALMETRLQTFATATKRRIMEMIPLTPERKAQRHGQDAATALDDVLADYLNWEEQDHEKSVEAIRRGNGDVLAGHTRPAEEGFEALRLKYRLPR